MTELKLEVGKTYLDRERNRVTISMAVDDSVYAFLSSEHKTYTENGRYSQKVMSGFDLISEHKEPAATPQPATRTPLIHAEQRIDYANGWDIECRHLADAADAWEHASCPSWLSSYVYRRKPEPAPLKPNCIKFVEVMDAGLGASTSNLKTLTEYGCEKSVRIEFNPNTQELVSAEVVTL